MKLMVCIVNDFYTPEIENRMEEKGYRMTELSSTGGFLRRGNTTFLFGIEDNQLEDFKKDLKDVCVTYEKKKGKKAETSHRFTSFLLNTEDALFLSAKMK
ncbi:cyclic-di-AMP receptor [Alteribacillus iranensis]|uniref:Uncharacterized protein YaaQ n=1 Tax=Alteribacillus iranensis TaxID=930128 RepID=A0A1I2F947_9BACI|nr:cyclic-di-AMP receptor [Alteribacillus iranensis]SFF01705.1 Uncharacterized protein YaaQ [Alteribacillus iranensis]